MTIPTDSLKTAKNRATDMANDAKDQIATSARELSLIHI